VDPTACIDLPAFPLQLLLKRNPDWHAHPAAVVEADTPQGTILWINDKARAVGIVTGMRYAAGLALASGLRAAVVSKKDIDDEITSLAELMRRFTPGVEPSRDEPGVFRLDAKGLLRLFGSLSEWASSLHAEIVRAGFVASLAVGFDRFACYAVAKGRRAVSISNSPQDERQAARAVRLDRLALPAAARDTLARLGVLTVGAFVDLPLDGIGVRFGPEVRRLHRLASGALTEPLKPEHPEPPAMRRLILDDPESDASRIVARIAEALPPMLDEIGRTGRALARLTIGFRFERLGEHVETIEPAAPTLSLPVLVELIRLRLQAVRKLPDGVMEIALLAGETPAVQKQRELFAVSKRRDLDAGARALARLKAAFGDDAVVRAELKDAHLPESRFAWVPVTALTQARPRPVDEPRLIRRIRTTPVPLPPRERHEPDGWLLRGLKQGPVVRINGPYAINGYWWRRPVSRDYHFAETKSGETMWVFYDRGMNRWFLQGGVE
jgi:protein ImuB